MNEKKMREEFEKWVEGEFVKAGPHRHTLDLMFRAYQAALSTKQQAGEPVAWVNAIKNLMREYWEIAFKEGSTGENLAERANDVLFRLDDLLMSVVRMQLSLKAPPRDVLMRVAGEVRRAQLKIVREGLQGGRWIEDIDDAVSQVDLAAIVDAALPGVEQPEPVNQQLLAALKAIEQYNTPLPHGLLGQTRSAISAAESAQAQQPQAVGVPDEMEIGLGASYGDAAYVNGWNACRDAMLAAAPKPEGGAA